MRPLYALPALLLTALLSGCAESTEPAAASDATIDDPARAEAAAMALPAPVSLHVEGDMYGSFGQAWTWPISEVTPSRFLVQFELRAANQGSPGYVLQDTVARLLDPAGMVQGEYQTAFSAGQFQQTAIEFQVPPYSAVTPGGWTLELSSGAATVAHYVLDVQVGYDPVQTDAETSGAEAGPAP